MYLSDYREDSHHGDEAGDGCRRKLDHLKDEDENLVSVSPFGFSLIHIRFLIICVWQRKKTSLLTLFHSFGGGGGEFKI